MPKINPKPTSKPWHATDAALAFAREMRLTGEQLQRVFADANRWRRMVSVASIPVGGEFHVPGLGVAGRVAATNASETTVEKSNGQRVGWSNETRVMPGPDPSGPSAPPLKPKTIERPTPPRVVARPVAPPTKPKPFSIFD